MIDPDSGNLDIWIVDLVRGVQSRFTVDPGYDTSPVWSPDGNWIAFGRDLVNRAEGAVFDFSDMELYNLFRKATDGSGREERLTESGKSQLPMDWSLDGRFLLYRETSMATSEDLWVMPGAAGSPGDRKSFPFVRTPFNERSGRFSPDGKWVAYESNESAKVEVYVRRFSSAAGQWQVSSNGGSTPRWRADGKELYYRSADGKLMAVPVRTTGDSFELGPAKSLFEIAAPTSGPYYDVAPDGQRFLVLMPAGRSSRQALTVVLNWQALLKDRR
jgi:Tol biopolymer transport system component